MLRFSPITESASSDIVYYDVGRSATVLVYEEEGSFHACATMDCRRPPLIPRGYAPCICQPTHAGRAASDWPARIRNRALIVGLGAGTAITGLPPTVEQADVIELEPKVVEANRSISDQSQISATGRPARLTDLDQRRPQRAGPERRRHTT